MIKRGIVFVFVLMILVTTVSATTYTYYVSSSSGSETNPGTISSPFKTIRQVNNAINALSGFGHNVIVRLKRGDVWSNDETLGYNGHNLDWAPLSLITIEDYGTGILPELDGNTQFPIRIYANPGKDMDVVIRNLRIYGQAFPYDEWGGSNTSRIYIYQIYGDITIDGLDINGIKDNKYRKEKITAGIYFGFCTGDGNIEIKNTKITNFKKSTWEDTKCDWGCQANDEFVGIYFWNGNLANSPLKTNGKVLIHDNVFTNSYSDGIQATNIRTTDNFEIYNNFFGIAGENAIDLKGCRYVKIYDNEFTDAPGAILDPHAWQCGETPHSGCEDSQDTCLANGQCNFGMMQIVQHSSDPPENTIKTEDVEIFNNYFHDSQARPFTTSPRIKIYNNFIKDCMGFLVIYDHKSDIYNNVVWINNVVPMDYVPNMYEWMIPDRYTVFYFSSEVNHNVNIVNLFHNTVYINDDNFMSALYFESSPNKNIGYYNGNENINIKNNVFYMTKNNANVYPVKDASLSRNGIDLSNNIYFNLGNSNRISWGGVSYTTTNFGDFKNAEDKNGISLDPGLKNPANKELWPDSQTDFVVNKGIDVGVSNDYLLKLRDANPDIGAYEYLGELICIHKSEIPPCDGKVKVDELMGFIQRWKDNETGISISDIISAIGFWKNS